MTTLPPNCTETKLSALRGHHDHIPIVKHLVRYDKRVTLHKRIIYNPRKVSTLDKILKDVGYTSRDQAFQFICDILGVI
jgi:hypothetical protein